VRLSLRGFVAALAAAPVVGACGTAADAPRVTLAAAAAHSTGVRSPDGKHEVFLRAHGQQALRDPPVSITDNRVMLRDVSSGAVVEVARNDSRSGCLSLWGPTFVDDRTVLLVMRGYEMPTKTNEGVCLLDLPTRSLHVLAVGTTCALPITVGRLRGGFYVTDYVNGGDSPRIVDRTGQVMRLFDGSPFVRDWNGDGTISDDEQTPECLSPAPPRAELEKIMLAL